MRSQGHKVTRSQVNSKIKISFFLLFACVLVSWCPGVLFAQSISSTELINNAKQYDGKTATYEGEVIGDIMARGDYAWMNVNDGTNAIGVWIDRDLTKDVQYTGSYRSKGDWIEVTGVFHRACLEHGGDLDIHAQTIRKLSPGRTLSEGLNVGKKNLVFVLAGILCLIWILRLLKRK